MDIEEFIKYLLSSRSVVTSPFLWANMVLFSEAILRIASNYGKASALLCDSFRVEVLEQTARRRGLERVISLIKFEALDPPLLVFELDKCVDVLEKCAVPIFATASKWIKQFRDYGFRRITVKRSSPSTNSFRFISEDFTAIFRITPYGIEKLTIPKYLERALKVLEDSLQIYGSFKVRDAVTILMHELGISKPEAQSIIKKLISMGLLRVERGFIEV